MVSSILYLACLSADRYFAKSSCLQELQMNSLGDRQTKIVSFTDLIVWKEAHEIVLHVYKLTDVFPNKEVYSLTDQMRRCAISITSNIAEGFSRKGKKEKLQFYFTAKGSLTELQNQLLVAKDVGYLSKSDFDEAAQQTILVHKLLNGFIKSAEAKY